QHQYDAERAERIVASLDTPRAAQVAQHGAQASQEIGEARRGAAEESPVDAEDDETEQPVATPAMPLEPAGLTRPPTESEAGDQQPVEQARRHVPDPDAGLGRRVLAGHRVLIFRSAEGV